MPASIRRTASTPNVRATASPVDPSIMPFGSNGKGVRNKLGYHRTSVACGHCRRRKIRCLLAADDPQGRCSNCIRLKKECNFFPVDQQPPLNRPSQSSHKTERTSSNGSSSASESPPSTQGLGRAPGMGSHSVPYHSYPSASQAPGPPGFPGPLDRQRTDSASSKGRGVVPIASTPHGSRPQLPHLPPGPGLSAGYDPTRPERPTGWEGSPYLDQSPMSANGGKPVLEDPATSFWRLAESPMGPSVPSFQGPPPPPPHQLPMIHHRESVGVFPYHVQREEMSWPSRSMSYGQLEGLGANHSGGQYPPPQTPDFKHPPPSTLYPPPYAGTGQYPVTSTPEPSSAPADGRGPNGAFAMHPPWHPSYTGNTIGPMAGKEAEGYNGWFQGSNRLSQVDEEVHTGPLNEDPSTMYQGTNQSSG
ncbi:MAG: hypothetical protein M1823_000737 [Watsoniomyces obsoletus]|nr:MAG: hypothetical protein M1823_000737 [Watsoniomyces obsoletus]